ncbi:MAG: amidohydrolase [Robiginitomaculum sp.]|nr:MAG: amidohydrolase [Robiginitomaculum sp.]
MTVSGLALFVLLASCSSSETKTPEASAQAPDLCIENATVYTGEGTAIRNAVISVTNGTIDALGAAGDTLDCQRYADQGTKIINLEGSFVYPGFVDAHSHFLGIGLRELTLNLEGTASIKMLKERLGEVVKSAPVGSTIYGRGWIETHWPENRFPTRQDLDEVAPDHPVILNRADGHASVVNTKALEMSGITKDTKPPFGGDILLGKDATPTGMLIDMAQSLVSGLLTEPSLERKQAAYIKAGEVYAAYGWTGTQSMSGEPENIKLLEQLSDEGKVGLRVYNAVDITNAGPLLDAIASDGPQSNANGHIVSRGVKLYVDGALGSRGAALLAPYSDDPENSGLLLTEKSTILPILERALRDGIQVSTHAIGDRANRLALDWYEESFANVPVSERKVAEPRWRIEHSQILDVTDIKRFAELGVIASMQPSHAIGDLYFAPDRLGSERLQGGYAWRSLIDSGAIIAGGSDAPVERGDPRIEFYAAVARKSVDGFSNSDWNPEQRVTREEALKMFTVWAAYAAFEEDSAGTITVGKNADFTVFDKDIMTIPEAEILTLKTVMTIVDGIVVYKNPD